jgi:hypothetical protein
MFNFFRPRFPYGTGCVPDQIDVRDYGYEEVAAAGEPVDWEKGFDIERELDIVIPFKDQDGSSSCVGQGWSYYGSGLDAVETGYYRDQSAKAIYSQISLGLHGGAYIRDGAKLLVNWGSLPERLVSSYENGNPPREEFMIERTWKTPEMDRIAQILQAKEYRTFSAASNMDLFAMAIRDNWGVVGGLRGDGAGNWGSFEPKPPVRSTWAHCMWWAKFGIDKLGKFIAGPNSWGTRGTPDALHPDGWQKFREEWFDSRFMFNPWTLVDKPNVVQISDDANRIIKDFEKKFVLEGEGAGRKGIIVGGQLRPVRNERQAAASIYVQNNNGYGITVSSKIFNELPKGANF